MRCSICSDQHISICCHHCSSGFLVLHLNTDFTVHYDSYNQQHASNLHSHNKLCYLNFVTYFTLLLYSQINKRSSIFQITLSVMAYH